MPYRLFPSSSPPLPCLAPPQAVTLHNTLCTFLGECSFPPQREVQPLLLHSREQGALLAAVNATLAQCVTGWPAVYRDDVRLLRKVCGSGCGVGLCSCVVLRAAGHEMHCLCG